MVKIIVTSLLTPSYDLQSVQAAVAANNVIFEGNSVRDRGNLGYTPEDAMSCLRKLAPNNFHKSEAYRDGALMADVYKLRHEHEGCIDPLYIKLRLATSGCLILSFHRER